MSKSEEMRPLEDWVLMATDEDDWQAENLVAYPERLNESLTHCVVEHDRLR